jgi:hypothetical protein
MLYNKKCPQNTKAATNKGTTITRWDRIRYGNIPESTTTSLLLFDSFPLFRRWATS